MPVRVQGVDFQEAWSLRRPSIRFGITTVQPSKMTVQHKVLNRLGSLSLRCSSGVVCSSQVPAEWELKICLRQVTGVSMKLKRCRGTEKALDIARVHHRYF